MQFVNSIKKRVLHRTDPRGIFGRELDGPTPPQPVMSIVDHLRLYGCDTEGVFRKSPKQSTMRECRSEMERGLVPDYKKYGTHVLASVLKDYLRSIPGKILLSGNYDLWIKEVVDEPDHEKKITACRNLLDLLPTSHWILLAHVLKLLNKIANSPNSKMSASALSVCLAPSFLDTSVQSSDPLESGKKIPLLVEFLIMNAVEVTPPGFNADNVFSILNPIDYNANHLCSAVPTCSDDDSSQRTPIIEEMGVNSPSLDVTRGDFLTDRTPRFLGVIDEDDGVLSFSDSEDELEVIRRPLSRASFRSETLRQQNESPPDMEDIPHEKSVQLPKVDERKQSDSPRSPCLKRIHFQRKQEQVQLRTSDLIKYDTNIDHKVERQKEEKIVPKVDTPPRKESREEATQTSDCGLPRIGDCDSSFSTFHLSTPNTPQTDHSIPNSPLVRREAFGMDNTSRPILKDAARGDEPQKPTVHVHPFTSDRNSEDPMPQTITERLQILFHNPSFADKTTETSRRSFLSSTRRQPSFRHSYIDIDKSPRLSRKFGESISSPTTFRRSVENRAINDDQNVSSYKHQELFSKHCANKHPDHHIITERFSSYCIEPPSEDQFKKDFSARRSDITRSYSQRCDKNTIQRDVQRVGSVKTGRRSDTCVGMDSLEINWSVRQLKTLFQDTKAPSINTDYKIS